MSNEHKGLLYNKVITITNEPHLTFNISVHESSS